MNEPIQDGYLKLPDFEFSEVVERKASEIFEGYFQGLYFEPQIYNEVINKTLHNLYERNDKIQFLSYIINRVVVNIEVHDAKCTTKDCPIVPDSQEFLYFLYGKLKENGLDVRKDLFSSQEVYENNQKIDLIIQKLTELQVGQEVLFNEIEEVKDGLESAKSLQVLGKKKFYTYLKGFFGEKLSDKAFESIWDSLKPLVKKLINDVDSFKLLG